MNKLSLYITGTDTDAGKTWVTTECLRALSTKNFNAVGMKPVASGCEMTSQGLRNDDALKLIAASSISVRYELVNPIALREPTAPEIAAKHDAVEISLEPVLNAYLQIKAEADIVLVEGVGGWLAPLSDTLDQSALVHALQCPVILVVGLKLGCINHARLTERALKEDGIDCVGWIAANTDPDLLFAEEYFEALQRCMASPFLGRVFADKPARLDGFVACVGAIHESPLRDYLPL
ncbi:MAG: dethiobiotin synthase [Arenimonas sp.]